MPFFVAVILFSSSAIALLDFLSDQAKKAVEVSAYADAASELINEVSPSDEIKAGASDLKDRADRLRSESRALSDTSQSTQSIINGPDWSSRRLDENMRSTAEYLRRIKQLLSRLGALGTDGAIALNTTETNLALNEMQKNQQALILQNQEQKIMLLERDQAEAKSWAEFSAQQKKVRARGPRGKL